MGNLTTEYRRRIAKLLKKRAEIARKGTNHIDDNWGEDTIYKGEIAVHLDGGKLYTSDGSTAVKLNAPNAIRNGLQLMPIDSNNGNACWIKISSGRALINGKTYWHESVADKPGSIAMGDFCFAENSSQSPIYYLVYARPFKSTDSNYYDYAYDDETQTANMNFFAISVKSEDDLYRDNYDDLLGDDKDNCIFLGSVLVPGNYTSGSENKLRPWSVSTCSAGRKYNFIDDIVEDGEEVSPSELMWKIKSGMANYSPSDDPREHLYLVEGQVFTSGAAMYIVLETHYCESIDKSLEDEKIVIVGGGGGGTGSTTNHAELTNLDYKSSGHRGFQKRTTVSALAPSQYNFGASNPEQGDFYIKVQSDGTVDAGFVYVTEGSSGRWVEFINCTKDSLNLKDLGMNDLTSVTFIDKQDGTYIGMSVNGQMCSYKHDYKFFKDNVEVEMKEVDNDSEYEVKWVSNDFDLDENDLISFYYLESAPIIIDTTEWNVLEGGSSTNGMW